jgi:uncharacterized protein YdeI (YjbR/CyaY-like superfamily)
MDIHKDVPVFLFETQKEWEEWLHKHNDQYKAIWITFAKKDSGAVTLTYDEALEVALCYGWIDGLVNALDERYYLTRFTPRGPKSIWSKRNQDIVAKLIADKKMQPSGFSTIETAKANGSWHNAYDSSRYMEVPEDFLKELAKDKKAEEFFKSLNKANTYAIAWRLQTAKKPETRSNRLQKLLTMMKKGEKLH